MEKVIKRGLHRKSEDESSVRIVAGTMSLLASDRCLSRGKFFIVVLPVQKNIGKNGYY